MTTAAGAAQFGFTDDETQYHAVLSYRDAATADGWQISPTYDSESVDRAASLERDGFHISVLSREHTNRRWRFEAIVLLWGPDGLAIRPPATYDMAQIRAGVTTCHYCERTDVPTKRVSFAGRCCEACLPEQRKRQERPGWCD